jgi:trehalose 6-phosphate phosphatase
VRLRASLRADAALFVGDDATDEDIFAIDDPARLLSVRIGHRSDSAAPYFLKSRREIDDLLACLLQLRPAESGVSAPASA